MVTVPPKPTSPKLPKGAGRVAMRARAAVAGDDDDDGINGVDVVEEVVRDPSFLAAAGGMGASLLPGGSVAGPLLERFILGGTAAECMADIGEQLGVHPAEIAKESGYVRRYLKNVRADTNEEDEALELAEGIGLNLAWWPIGIGKAAYDLCTGPGNHVDGIVLVANINEARKQGMLERMDDSVIAAAAVASLDEKDARRARGILKELTGTDDFMVALQQGDTDAVAQVLRDKRVNEALALKFGFTSQEMEGKPAYRVVAERIRMGADSLALLKDCTGDLALAEIEINNEGNGLPVRREMAMAGGDEEIRPPTLPIPPKSGPGKTGRGGRRAA